VSSKGNGDTEGLVRGVQAGDPEAFTAVVDRMRGRLEMWIRVRMGPLLRSRLAADDVFQETLIQAYRSLDAFKDTGPGSFQRWMFSVAENRLKDLHKYHAAQKRHPAHEAADAGPTAEERRIVDRLAGDGTTPSQGVRRTEIAERLSAALARIPDDLRELIVLRVIEDLSFREITERIGTDARAARGLYARALRELQRALTGGKSLT
jgi:RNA polymerase sigma-70 factor (ECF subfamily)